MDFKDTNNKNELIVKIDELFKDFNNVLKNDIKAGDKKYKKAAQKGRQYFNLVR